MATYNLPPVHGRGSASFRIILQDATGSEINLSADDVYLEIPSANIRETLAIDPDDASARFITLSRDQVEALSLSPVQYAVIDETDPTYPQVLLSGTVRRNGYVLTGVN